MMDEEFEILKSLYSVDEISLEKNKINLILDKKFNHLVKIILPKEYPEESPIIDIMIPDATALWRNETNIELDTLLKENLGEPVLYQILELIKESYTKVQNSLKPSKPDPKIISKPKVSTTFHYIDQQVRLKNLNIQTYQNTITDKKSIFQAHVCKIYNSDDAKLVTTWLKMSNNKILNATHNITAYRIKKEKYLASDCDDDGEKAAGSRLLHLLDMMKVENLFVMVTRWYGGIHLGPDRFKHINNVASEAIKYFGHV